jgi:rRNA maturation endonuclease Nob1
MADLKTIFNKTNEDGWDYVRNQIIDRISNLTVQCPECESIIHDDEQYQCGTCGGGGEIYVLSWIKAELAHVR